MLAQKDVQIGNLAANSLIRLRSASPNPAEQLCQQIQQLERVFVDSQVLAAAPARGGPAGNVNPTFDQHQTQSRRRSGLDGRLQVVPTQRSTIAS